MFVIRIVLFALSLNAIIDATRVTYTNLGGRVYVETGPQNYAMFGQVKNKLGKKIVVAVNNKDPHPYET